MKKTVILILVLVLAAGAYYGYSLYNKEHINVAETEASFSFSAAELFEVFISDEEAANVKYTDQIIECNGTVYQLDLSNEANPQVVLEANGDNGYIRCGFKPEVLESVKNIKSGDKIKLKGECKGINSAEGLDLLADIDVVLSNCIIIE